MHLVFLELSPVLKLYSFGLYALPGKLASFVCTNNPFLVCSPRRAFYVNIWQYAAFSFRFILRKTMYMRCISIYVRKKKKRDQMHSRSYIPANTGFSGVQGLRDASSSKQYDERVM